MKTHRNKKQIYEGLFNLWRNEPHTSRVMEQIIGF